MSDQAQRVTTEDNKDQGALNVMACALHDEHADWCADDVCAIDFDDKAQRILSALAEAGYTVVKTEWEWFEGQRRHKAIPAGHWIPVPEGGEQ